MTLRVLVILSLTTLTLLLFYYLYAIIRKFLRFFGRDKITIVEEYEKGISDNLEQKKPGNILLISKERNKADRLKTVIITIISIYAFAFVFCSIVVSFHFKNFLYTILASIGVFVLLIIALIVVYVLATISRIIVIFVNPKLLGRWRRFGTRIRITKTASYRSKSGNS